MKLQQQIHVSKWSARIFMLMAVNIIMTPLLYSQSPFRFDKVEHQFGEIPETGGDQRVTFTFKNTGNDALVITEVNASCGCTTPEYTKDTILPGHQGWITAIYNPIGRPGPFEKHVFVTFNNIPSLSMSLAIKGNVMSSVTPDKYTYTVPFGGISASETHIDMGIMMKEGIYSATFQIANDMATDVRIYNIKDLPSFIKVQYPRTLKAGEKADVKIDIDRKDMNQVWGDFTYRIIFLTDDPLMSSKVFFVKGVIKQDFSHLTKQDLKMAPKVKVSTHHIDFGEVKRGAKKEVDIVLENIGKSDLEIRKIHSPCYCLSGKSELPTLAPGQKTTIKVLYDALGQAEGIQNRALTIYTNDPNQSDLVIKGKANIKL
jgi:hypothetical protein